MFPDYLLNYIDNTLCLNVVEATVQVGCSLLEVTATRRWEEATALQLHPADASHHYIRERYWHSTVTYPCATY